MEFPSAADPLIPAPKLKAASTQALDTEVHPIVAGWDLGKVELADGKPLLQVQPVGDGERDHPLLLGVEELLRLPRGERLDPPVGILVLRELVAAVSAL